jgi:hypothetical protein
MDPVLLILLQKAVQTGASTQILQVAFQMIQAFCYKNLGRPLGQPVIAKNIVQTLGRMFVIDIDANAYKQKRNYYSMPDF